MKRYILLLVFAASYLLASFSTAAQNHYASVTSLQWSASNVDTRTFTLAGRDSTIYQIAFLDGEHFSYTPTLSSSNVVISVTPRTANTSSTAITDALSIYNANTGLSDTVTLTHDGSTSGGGAGGGTDPGTAYTSDLTADSNYIQRTTFTSSAGSSYYRDVDYYDGLGYVSQAVSVGASPTGHSIVRPVVYDNMRRGDATTYLPYVSGAGSGAYDSSSLSHQSSYYTSVDLRPYASRTYGTSYLGKVKSDMRAGSAWSVAGRKINISYGGYVSSDNVMRLQYSPSSSGVPTVSCSSVGYSTGDLAVMTTTDENLSVTKVFSDVFGKTVCVRTYSGSSGAGTASDTYYVYDLRDSLALVIQPEGAAALAALGTSSRTITLSDNNSNANNNIYSRYCFSWIYDGCGNLLQKHIPGGGTYEYVYDARGRLVLEKGPSMSGRYVYVEYDQYDREVSRKCVSTSLPLSTLRTSARGTTSSSLPSSITSSFSSTYTMSTREYFPLSSWSTYPNTGASYAFQTESGIATSTELETTRVKGMLMRETIYAAPGNDGSAPSTTASLSRSYHYDSRGRVIQMVEKGSDGWTSRYSTKYDFLGNVLVFKESHAPSSGTSHYVKTTYTYDSRGRVLSCSRNVDGVQKAAVSYSYDDLGRLSSKSLGNNCTESLSYDVHGWTTQIQAKFGSTELFRENLRYNAPTKNASSRARYDGLISEISSIHNGQTAQVYSYAYDGMKRLTDADHYIGTSTSTTLKDTEKGISYDRNGNISSMTRYGSSSTANTLSFTLTGNRVTGLSGSASSTFAYDASGNRTSDSRKGLTMSYNILNLPKSTTKSGSSLTYVYLSDGTKVSAQQSGGAGLKYRGAFVYDVTSSGTETLNSVAWDEGRLDYSASQTSPKDEWFVKDHLGNVRSVVNLSATTASAAVLEQNDYLPFGTRASTPTLNTSNRYRYAGKENQKVGSVDLALLDFGARLYDPNVCSWTSTDSMAEKYPGMSPYNYCMGNPMNIVDPDGRDIFTVDQYGILKYVVSNSKIDRIDIVDPEYTIIASSNGYSGGSIINNSEVGEELCFQTTDWDLGIVVFEFISKNTKVEVGNILSTSDTNVHSDIFTDGKIGEINMISRAESILNNGNSLWYMIHSHPGGLLPSGFNEGYSNPQSDKRAIGFKEMYSSASDVIMLVYRANMGIYNRFDNATTENFDIYCWSKAQFRNTFTKSKYNR